VENRKQKMENGKWEMENGNARSNRESTCGAGEWLSFSPEKRCPFVDEMTVMPLDGTPWYLCPMI